MEFRFGTVAYKSEWELDASANSGSIVRSVQTGVGYSRALDPADMPFWIPTDGKNDRFKLRAAPPIPAASGRPSTLTSLFTYGQNIRSSRGYLRPDDPRLVEIEWLVARLLGLLEKLHAARRSIGMVHPFNVFWYALPNGERHMILPDVGFSAPDRS